MAQQVYTSFWANPELGDLDARLVSISRGQPRWPLPFRYKRLRALAPNDEAWQEKDMERFEAAYIVQLEALGIRCVLADLERIAGNHACVLLCWEKPGEFCHRRVLASWIQEQTGILIPELAPGMVAKTPDAPQPSLFDGEERA